MDTPLQDHLPDALRAAAALPLPRMQPVSGPWIAVDSAYSSQCALRTTLLAREGTAVLRCLPGAEAAAEELREEVLRALSDHPDFDVRGDAVTCPDGRHAKIGDGPPLEALNRVLAEDLCLLEKREGEHVLVAASLCFPAGWTLAEKIGRPLGRIHAPVPPYDYAIARRVQRFFDGVRPGRALWRANLHGYDRPDLFQPLPESAPKPKVSADPAYLRSERQTVLRLPRTGAVLFAIHTTVVATKAGDDTGDK